MRHSRSLRVLLAAAGLAVVGACGTPEGADRVPATTPAASRAATPATTPADPGLGPELAPDEVGALPRRGVAVGLEGAAAPDAPASVEETVVLLDLEGTVLGHLTGYRVDPSRMEAGPVTVVGSEGDVWLLDGAGMTRSEQGRERLAFGAELLSSPRGTSPPTLAIVRGDVVLFEASDEVVEVTPSWDRSLVTLTAGGTEGSRLVPVSAVLLDLGTGSESPPPPAGCQAVERSGAGLAMTCSGEGAATLETLSPDGTRAVVAPAPDADWEIPSGRWRVVMPSPDHSAYLGQWSGECEIPTAVWVEGGTSTPITGVPLPEAPDSYALGWTETGEAVVLLAGYAPCGSAASDPGIYLATSPTSLTSIFPTGERLVTARMWSPLPGA